MAVSFVALLSLAAATVLAAPQPAPVRAELALVTPAPNALATARALRERDLASDIASFGEGLLSGAASYVTDGIPQFFQDLPTGSQVIDKIGAKTEDIDALPTQALNIPSYANWTGSSWSLRMRGNIYKLPDIKQDKVDNLANVFLIDTSVKDLPFDQQAQARNFTRSIFVVQQDNQKVVLSVGPGGANGSTGASKEITLPNNTTEQGDFDIFVPIDSSTYKSGADTGVPQQVSVYVKGTDEGNATSFLVPKKGLTVISDIDDILRITKIYQPKEGLLNSFARPFVPWMNMPEIYANWSTSLPETHFHYLTTTPEQVTRNYMDFIYKTYPLGSFDTRPLNFSDVKATLSIRRFLLDKVFQTYPERKFILVADTSNSDVMRAYPALAKDYPGQVACIFLRNTSSTDSGDKFPYNTAGFEGLNQQLYMFFNVPDDLRGLDVANGQCYNSTIKQNVTFGYQGLPFGFGNKKGAGSRVLPSFVLVGVVVSALSMLL